MVVHQVYPARVLPNCNFVPEATLHWLMHPWLRHECSRLEAEGFITDVQGWINGDKAMLAEWRRMQEQYSVTRWSCLERRDQDMFESNKWSERFNNSGVGGVRGWEDGPVKLKCLHLHYAHYLVQRATARVMSVMMVEEIDVVLDHGKDVECPLNLAGRRVHEEIISRHK